jgi:bile acid-coenzyme A ligase
VVGCAPDEYAPTPSVPECFAPDASLSSAPLPERTAAALKAMTSGGSTGRPKLIVSKSPGAYDPETVTLEIQNGGVMLVPGPLYHNGPFLWAMDAVRRRADAPHH